ncbi:RNA polymerase sigma factor [Nisaea sp.]|uniref:RNA polymerase sigma factor n=1 Tax=Nisaea sp. TaxID=2024842 RepID=UPI003297063A
MGTENRDTGNGRFASQASVLGDIVAEAMINAVDSISITAPPQIRSTTRPPDQEAQYQRPWDNLDSDNPCDGAPVLPPDTFWDLWFEHQHLLLRQCMKMMSGNMADAEDALGNALVRASAHFAEGGGESIVNKRAWLSRLAHNACIDFYRARSRQKRWTDEIVAMADGDFIPSAPLPEPTPEDVAETGESMRSLQRGLDDLPERLRRPVILRFLEGRSYAEIAERLCITNCTARKRVQLARERLRRHEAEPV